SGLLEIAKIHQGEFRITGNQNLIISNIDPETKDHIQTLINKHGISFGEKETPIRLNSVACVAFPTCSLAMAEAERYLPDLISRIEGILEQYELLEQPINIRMTGCPNGCARPFLGEIGFVGKAPGKYNLYLGASFKGDRLNKLYKENINEQQILDELTPLLKDYAGQRNKGEYFGDFVIRQGYIRSVVNGLDFHG
ncbi:MAG: sulfite reductase, partial [Porticoccaceae bacterium]|nr:sulfite reductase [Porticoccaceae bacterium]